MVIKFLDRVSTWKNFPINAFYIYINDAGNIHYSILFYSILFYSILFLLLFETILFKDLSEHVVSRDLARVGLIWIVFV